MEALINELTEKIFEILREEESALQVRYHAARKAFNTFAPNKGTTTEEAQAIYDEYKQTGEKIREVKQILADLRAALVSLRRANGEDVLKMNTFAPEMDILGRG